MVTTYTTMDEAAGTQQADPDGQKFIDLLVAQLAANGHEPYGLNRTQSIPLINIFPTELLRELCAFVERCEVIDLLNLLDLIIERPTEPNRFAALINCVETIRLINQSVTGNNGESAAKDLGNVYAQLWFQEVSQMNELRYIEIKAKHFADSMGGSFVLCTDLTELLESDKEFRSAFDVAVPALVALAESMLSLREVKKTMLVVSRYLSANPELVSRVSQTIRNRRHFSPELMDSIIEADVTAVESGML